MNVLVEVALVAVPVPLFAIFRDIWIRLRVEEWEKVARADRLEKERKDRESAEDIAVLAHVGGWLVISEHTVEHELAQERQLNRDKQAEIETLKSRVADLLEIVSRLTKDFLDKNSTDTFTTNNNRKQTTVEERHD